MVLCDSDLGELLTTVAKCFQQMLLKVDRGNKKWGRIIDFRLRKVQNFKMDAFLPLTHKAMLLCRVRAIHHIY